MAYGLAALRACVCCVHNNNIILYGKCRPLNLCQNMQKKVKMDCIHKISIECAGVNSMETVRTALEDDTVSTLSVAAAVTEF